MLQVADSKHTPTSYPLRMPVRLAALDERHLSRLAKQQLDSKLNSLCLNVVASVLCFLVSILCQYFVIPSNPIPVAIHCSASRSLIDRWSSARAMLKTMQRRVSTTC